MQALEVPEILLLVGELLNYPRLAAATAVCKTWNTIFTPFLYHTIEHSHYLGGPSSVVLKDHVDHVRAIKLCNTIWIPPLAGCTYLKELHLEPIYKQDYDMVYADLVHQNPRLDTVCVTCPSNDFLRAVFTSCPQLKRLEINHANLTDIVMADLFNVCLRLEEFKMANTSLDVGKHHDDSWINWPTFPTIKKLWIGIIVDTRWYLRQAYYNSMSSFDAVPISSH